jgi:hypothetical protein
MQKKLVEGIWIKEASKKGKYALGETLEDRTLIPISVSWRHE